MEPMEPDWEAEEHFRLQRLESEGVMPQEEAPEPFAILHLELGDVGLLFRVLESAKGYEYEGGERVNDRLEGLYRQVASIRV